MEGSAVACSTVTLDCRERPVVISVVQKATSQVPNRLLWEAKSCIGCGWSKTEGQHCLGGRRRGDCLQ